MNKVDVFNESKNSPAWYDLAFNQNIKTMKYRLKKDTPYHKAGEVVELDDEIWLTAISDRRISYNLELLKDFDEWFEEIPAWTDEDMIKFLSAHSHLSYEGAKEKLTCLKILKEGI